ncbi:hypothetical protein [Gimesia aquarii]|uniref:Uncharacterized protein n=1 Tax=Gimesia aquarii TaxID=2527964 RepID=A0A517VP08_9PLAN|nr:hypothetical protein [Gimesia aquarii]QDT94761.1 hypothetical protein V144x_01920 [Gimesia aquarii]
MGATQMGLFMKRFKVYIILGFLTLFITFVIVTEIRETRREVLISAARGKLKYISVNFFNYEQIKGNSVFDSALEHNMSWRVLLSETFPDDLMNGVYDDILSQPTPSYLQNLRMPILLGGFFENGSSSLTSFRAIQFKEGYKDVDGKVSHWIVAFLPMKQSLWTSTETVSQEDFDEILSRQDKLQTKIYVVTEPGNVMQADQLMIRRLQN